MQTGYIVVALSIILGVVMVGMVIYYYAGKNKKKLEEPKYDIFNDDEETQ